MTLEQLLTAITQASILVVVLDSNDVELIKFYTGGQAQLSTSLLERVVTNIKIVNNGSIQVELAGASV